MGCSEPGAGSDDARNLPGPGAVAEAPRAYMEQTVDAVQSVGGWASCNQATGHAPTQDGSSVTVLPVLSQVTDHVTLSASRVTVATPASDPFATTALVGPIPLVKSLSLYTIV
jgi:hypothetical protein